MGKYMPFYVYILTNRNNTVFYTGFTENLKKRVREHKEKIRDGFTKQYRIENWFILKLLFMRKMQLQGKSKSKVVPAKRKLI
jgi:putative endonuclease